MRILTTSIWTTLLLCLLLTATCVGVRAEPPSADLIAQALKAQETACGTSLDVTFDLSSGPQDNRQTETTRYARTPRWLWADKTTPAGHSVNVYARDSHEWRWLDTVTVSSPTQTAYEAKSGAILDGLEGSPFATQGFPETTLYCTHEGPLCTAMRGGTVASEQEEIDGAKCWKVTIPSTHDVIDKTYVWVDPQIGFCPRQMQVVWKGTPPQMVRFLDYKEAASGVWFPTKFTVDLTTRNGDHVNVVTEVKKVTVGQRGPDEDLSLKFPSGTHVRVGHGKTAAVFTVP